MLKFSCGMVIAYSSLSSVSPILARFVIAWYVNVGRDRYELKRKLYQLVFTLGLVLGNSYLVCFSKDFTAERESVAIRYLVLSGLFLVT